ncbi:MAG TPA: LysM peptidoglycan-binding domain-containing protein [Bacilli bacterium]|nr:LysM peptidoglycan-binding domain-containing protein [Bacilli bacterium]
MDEYAIWLSFNNEEKKFRLPVNPESIELKEAGTGSSYEVSGLGEINVIKNPKLTGYRFDSLFPAQHYPFIVGDELHPPLYYINLIKEWMGTRRPIRFKFTGSSFNINEAVSIESFDWKEVAGSPGDIEYALELKQYVFYKAQKAVPVAQKATSSSTSADASKPVLAKQNPPRPDERQQPKTYTLVAGDTLWAVAQKFLGNGARYKEIQKLNQITDAEVTRLPVGKVIKLP